MDYAIYLSFNNQEEGFRIPVNPEKIEVTEGSNGKTYEMVGEGGGTSETRAGEVNVIKSPKLKQVTFSGLFPAGYSPFVVVDTLFEPMHYVQLIRKWMATKRPIRFIYAGHYKAYIDRFYNVEPHDTEINMPASIESFTWSEVAGSPGDIEYSLTLKEYVFYAARKVVPVAGKDGETNLVQQRQARPDERVRPERYTLQEGETNLWIVAKRVLGDGSRHKEIQELNNLTDADLETKLVPGLILKVPQN